MSFMVVNFIYSVTVYHSLEMFFLTAQKTFTIHLRNGSLQLSTEADSSFMQLIIKHKMFMKKTSGKSNLLPIRVQEKTVHQARQHVAQWVCAEQLQIVVLKRSVLSFHTVVSVCHNRDVQHPICPDPSLIQHKAHTRHNLICFIYTKQIFTTFYVMHYKWSANANRNAQQPGCMFETQQNKV